MSTSGIEYTVKEDRVVKIKIGGVDIPLLKPIDTKDWDSVKSSLDTLIKYIDFPKINVEEEEGEEWSKDDLEEFLEYSNDAQRMLFKILCEIDEMDRESLVDEMGKRLHRKYGGWDLGGALAGIGIRTKGYDYEPLWRGEWRRDGEWKCYYRLKPKYKPIVEAWLKSQGI